MNPIYRHFRHHRRFYAALAVGLVLWAALGRLAPSIAPVAAGDGFFAVFLAAEILFVARVTVTELRRHASVSDEGILVVVLITLTAISLSMGAIFSILNQAAAPDPFELGFAVASVPLGWLTFHTVVAFRYAHLYYAKGPARGTGAADAGGLAFPATEHPTAWDFLYFAFVIGMTAQVSDVQVLSARMRRLVLWHSLASFFFNTVILALAVNMAVVHRG
jgi:uncharacterized membrane protein